MHRKKPQFALIIAAVLLAAAACAPQSNGELPPELDPQNFDRPTEITNSFLPMTPGTRYVYEGITVEDDGAEVSHQVIIHITGLTKVIGGVPSLVSWDLDYSDGELVEAELAFFAQDNDGAVWRMGEFPVEYDGEMILDTPAWIHGIKDARAGIMMQAKPQTGTPSYAQGWGPDVDWTDRGQVDQVDQDTCVPADCYSDVLVIAETSASEPDAEQLKYYAPGVGNVRVGWRGEGEKTRETLELVKVEHLAGAALKEVQIKALELESLAYQESQDVYGLTEPILEAAALGRIEVATPKETAEVPVASLPGSPEEIVIYASDLPENALFELEFWDDEASPGGRLIGLVNNGDELDPPPENDPNATFSVQVLGGESYRCWIHMKVGEQLGKSTANVIYVAFSDALNEAGQTAYKIQTDSYLTAQGSQQQGWSWVGCDLEGAPALIEFPADGEITVRLQAGMEGVGFDQFILSMGEYLESPPVGAIVVK